jgi:hypothetical protein
MCNSEIDAAFAFAAGLTFFAGLLLGRIWENKRMRRIIERNYYDTGTYAADKRAGDHSADHL